MHLNVLTLFISLAPGGRFTNGSSPNDVDLDQRKQWIFRRAFVQGTIKNCNQGNRAQSCQGSDLQSDDRRTQKLQMRFSRNSAPPFGDPNVDLFRMLMTRPLDQFISARVNSIS